MTTTTPAPTTPHVCDRCPGNVLAVIMWRHHRRTPSLLTLCGHHSRVHGPGLVRDGWRADPVLPPVSADPTTH